jgi:4-coumarate--CoA ligase
MAFVVPRSDAARADAIIAATALLLSPHERIRRLEFVDSIPRSLSGKILRRLLRDRRADR